MTGKGQATGPGSAGWLLEKATAEPQVLARAGRYAADGGRSNDAWLVARRHIETAWDLAAEEPDYRGAAVLLERAGRGHPAEIFSGIAGTSGELAAARRAWATRQPAVTLTADAERVARQFADGLIELAGVPAQGVDGAWYQVAAHRDQLGAPGRAAVLVSTMTTRELVTGFTGDAAMRAWLRTRARDAGRKPVTEPDVEQPPRLVLEERVLAWLIRHPAWPGGQTGLRQRLWTADCRHEIDAALRTTGARDGHDGYRDTARELRRRSLRAPGWAADQVGWPHGQWVQQYLWRLAATPVTESAAANAITQLTPGTTAHADTVIADMGRRYGTGPGTGPARVWPVRDQAARPATEHDQRAADLYARYGPYYDRPDSVAARMRITRPGPQP